MLLNNIHKVIQLEINPLETKKLIKHLLRSTLNDNDNNDTNCLELSSGFYWFLVVIKKNKTPNFIIKTTKNVDGLYHCHHHYLSDVQSKKQNFQGKATIICFLL